MASEPKSSTIGITEETLEAGLRNAFGPDPADTERSSHSVLAALKRFTGPVSPLRLRELRRDRAGAAPAASAAPDRIAGAERYEILGAVGHGGMGEVLKGRDQDLGRVVAIKLLSDCHRDNPAMARRFVAEAQIGGQLQHPGIVPVHELGLTADERPYFTMRLVEGRTLAALLDERPAASHAHRRFLGIYGKVLEAMAYAHARGVIHRDLKPSNIMVGAFGEVQVMDWGLSKVLLEEDGGAGGNGAAGSDEAIPAPAQARSTGDRSETGSVMGTPAYMPPEQARGEVEKLDERSDVFSLGAILCEILTGEPPYAGDDAAAIRAEARAARLDRAAARLRGSGADPELIAIARRCLAPEREARYGDAGKVAAAFSAHLASLDERARAAEIAAAEARVKAAEERRARRLTLALAAAILLAILAAGIAYLWLDASRRERVARTSRAVTSAMQEAAALRERAEAATSGQLSLWTQARAAAERAVVLAREAELDPETLAWAARLHDELVAAEEQAGQAAQQADRDRRLVERLEEIRAHAADVWLDKGDFEAVVDTDYARAFEAHGIDVDALDTENAARLIRASTIAMPLVAALDDWVGVRKRRAQRATRISASAPAAPDWERLHAIAQAADPDEIGSKVREAGHANDLARLRELADQAPIDSWPIPTLELLGNSLGTAGDVERAVSFLTEVQRTHPRDFWVQYDLGIWLGRTRPRRTEEAARCFTAAVAIRPRSAAAWTNLGVALTERRDLPGALRAEKEALRLNPQSPAAHQTLGSILVELGRPAEATAAIEEALRIQPDHVSSHAALANALRASGRLEDALVSARKALGMDPERADLRYMCGRVLEDLEKLDDAQAAYRKAIELDPYLADAHVHLGLTLKKSGRPDAAVAEYEKALRVDPEHPVAHLNLGVIFADRGDLDQAVVAFRRAILARPDYVDAHNDLGALLARRGDLEGAAASFRRALELEPNNVKALLLLGRVLTESGKPGEAAEYVEKALRIRPDDFEALTSLGAIWTDHLGDREKGLAYVRKAASVNPENAIAHFNLGVTLAQEERYAKAIAEFEAAIERDPRSVDALVYLGDCQELLQDWPAAAAAFKRALEIRADLPAAQKSLGNVLRAMGDRAGAIRAFEAAARLDPRDAAVRVSLARLVAEEGDLERAITIDREAIRIQPDSAQAWYDLGVALTNAGQCPEAADAFREAARLRSDLPQLRRAYGVALGICGNAAEAVEELKAALELAPESEDIRDRLEEFRALATLEAKLPAILDGTESVSEPATLLRLASLCSSKNLHAASARFWKAALDANPQLGEDEGHRYNAACAAALAGSGRGADTATLTADDRARWRLQAIAWLHLNLAAIQRRLAAGDENDPAALARTLAHWLRDPDLAGIRDPHYLALLSATEAAACESVWQEHNDVWTCAQ
ncbi:MAG: tetratricopeptide repeat protein [Planctomycetes bacterium]|nr:tetratricopeptide repeat protein [Planctomycetota bacterium]